MNYSELLQAKVNSYKSYTQQVKEYVICNFITAYTGTIDEKAYNTALQRLPKVMKEVKKRLITRNKWLKEVVRLEIHKYTPELNKLHTKTHVFKVPQMVTIETALTYLISKNEIV